MRLIPGSTNPSTTTTQKWGGDNKQINDYYEKTRVQPDDWDVVGIDKTEIPLTLDLGTNVPDSWKTST